MTDNFTNWYKYTADVNQIIKQYLNQTGIPPTFYLVYFSFSKKILSIVKKYHDKNLIDKFVGGNIQYYKTTFDANEKVLRDVAKIVVLAKIEGKKPEEILKEVLGVTAN